jgi:hypothetical protein
MVGNKEEYQVRAVERVNDDSRQVTLVRTIKPNTRLARDITVLVYLPNDEFPEAAIGQLVTLWFFQKDAP